MKTHRTAIKATLAGLLLATACSVSLARAGVPDAECVAGCRQMRHAGMLQCAADNDCGTQFKLARSYCVALTAPGPERRACYEVIRAQRTECRTDAKACKQDCGGEYDGCRSACSD